MSNETTPPVTSLVDEVLAELDQSAVGHRELNTSNYDHHDICQLNDWGVDACTALEKAADLIRQQRAELTSIEAMARMLEDGEWAEHVGQLGGPIAQRLETDITRMHNEQQALIAQQAATVAVPAAYRDNSRVPDDYQNAAAGYRAGWNDCRAAMLAAPGDTAAPEPTATAREQLRVRLEQLEKPAVKVPRDLISRLVAGLEWALPELNREPFEWSSGDMADAHRAALQAIKDARATLGQDASEPRQGGDA